MILSLIGLGLSFVGSIFLLIDALINFGKPKSITSVIYKENNTKEYIHYKREKDRGFKQAKVTPEQIKLIVALSLLSVGFLCQIIDSEGFKTILSLFLTNTK